MVYSLERLYFIIDEIFFFLCETVLSDDFHSVGLKSLSVVTLVYWRVFTKANFWTDIVLGLKVEVLSLLFEELYPRM